VRLKIDTLQISLFRLYSKLDIIILEMKWRRQKSPSFDREYNLKYHSEIGNVFDTNDTERCKKRDQHAT
jgi:hypothetical protein